MAIVWMDNFQGYGVGQNSTVRQKLLDGAYAACENTVNGGTQEDPDPNGTNTVFFVGSDTDALRYAVATPGDVYGVALRVYLNQLPASASNEAHPISFRNIDNNDLVRITVRSNGAITAYKGTTALGTTAGPVITAQSWKHIEAKCVIHASTGSVVVKVEGVTVLNLTGLDTTRTDGFNDICQIAMGCDASSSTSYHVTDFIVWDDSGTVNNDFVGPCAVYLLQPDGDVSSGWASTGANKYGVIDELTPDDADYISADATLPAATIVTLENLPDDVVAVKALMTVVREKKSDGGDAQTQVSLLSSGDADDGQDRVISTAYTYHADVSELDPHVAAVWTPTTVNAATLKIARTV